MSGVSISFRVAWPGERWLRCSVGQIQKNSTATQMSLSHCWSWLSLDSRVLSPEAKKRHKQRPQSGNERPVREVNYLNLQPGQRREETVLRTHKAHWETGAGMSTNGRCLPTEGVACEAASLKQQQPSSLFKKRDRKEGEIEREERKKERHELKEYQV